MLKMIFIGMKRRKKEIRYVSLVTFVAVLFMTGITLFQSIMNDYVFYTNLHNYGDWVISSVNKKQSHPYLLAESSCTTGISLVNDKAEENNILAGKADENFLSLYDEVLYEGRMPMENNEIAMDISSLAVLGYSYDVGQTVVVSYMDGNGTIQQEQYLLVGTLKNFSAIWKCHDAYALPNFFVTEEEFEKYKTYAPLDSLVTGEKHENTQTGVFTTYFYRLNPDYSEINTYEFAMSFISADADGGFANPVTYNKYVYENKVWGSPEMFENVTRAIFLIAALAIGYLLIAYTGKRRETYYRYRCIGAAKKQVRGILMVECLYAALPQIFLGMGSAYILAAIGCQVVEQAQYIFDVELFVEQLLTALSVIVLAIIATQFTISDKRLAGNTGRVKPAKYKKLRRLARRSTRPEKTLFQRQNMLHSMQPKVSALFSIVVCGCLVLCVFKVCDRAADTARILEHHQDFTMSYEDVEKYYYEFGSVETILHNETYEPSDLTLGVDEQFMEAVRTSPGVKNVEPYWTDQVHYFKWEGMEKSPVMNFLKQQQMYHTPLEYGMEMTFYNDLEELKKSMAEGDLELIETADALDWEAVEKGEQAVLYIGTSYEVMDHASGELTVRTDMADTTIQAGDTLNITHFQEDYSTPVEIGAVIYSTVFLNEGYDLVGTKALAERIITTEGKTLKYNNLEIMYDSSSSYESTDKQLASLANNHGMRYASGAEARRMAAGELIQDIGIYGVLFMVILVVYVTLQNSFLASKYKYMQECYMTLKRIGMEDRQYMQGALWTEAKSYLWLLAGMLFGYLLIFRDRYIFNVVYGTAEEYILRSAIREVEFLDDRWFFLVVFLLYSAMLVNATVVIKKSIQGGKTQ